ncbi:MAG: hypothetical protein V4501_09450 [Pseudomonadota bacterium]
MRKLLVGLVLFAAAQLAFAGISIPITFYNYTSEGGAVFLGTAPEVTGPVIGLNGDSVQWTPVVNGKQIVGLQTSSQQICFLTGGQLALNAALYTGDTISVVYGQQQFPTGITCGCLGSACDIA